ncbi:C-type natriuretic peptide 4-like [Hoplias malabaricus]|uniref:C-type natriuretic peptide 4-like n=1 Tax=Hoplias malabaricus TaxID=27720 RepID=UPI003461D7FE
MEIPCVLMCGLLMVSLSLRLSAKHLTSVQDQVPAANSTLNLTVTDIVPGANSSHAGPDVDTAAHVKNLAPARRKQTNRQSSKQANKREKRKNCFGFKMDRISDLSGMGCRKD